MPNESRSFTKGLDELGDSGVADLGLRYSLRETSLATPMRNNKRGRQHRPLFTVYPVFAQIFDLITKTRIPLFRRKGGTAYFYLMIVIGFVFTPSGVSIRIK